VLVIFSNNSTLLFIFSNFVVVVVKAAIESFIFLFDLFYCDVRANLGLAKEKRLGHCKYGSQHESVKRVASLGH
jgi:hypothetical protein